MHARDLISRSRLARTRVKFVRARMVIQNSREHGSPASTSPASPTKRSKSDFNGMVSFTAGMAGYCRHRSIVTIMVLLFWSCCCTRTGNAATFKSGRDIDALISNQKHVHEFLLHQYETVYLRGTHHRRNATYQSEMAELRRRQRLDAENAHWDSETRSATELRNANMHNAGSNIGVDRLREVNPEDMIEFEDISCTQALGVIFDDQYNDQICSYLTWGSQILPNTCPETVVNQPPIPLEEGACCFQHTDCLSGFCDPMQRQCTKTCTGGSGQCDCAVCACQVESEWCNGIPFCQACPSFAGKPPVLWPECEPEPDVKITKGTLEEACFEGDQCLRRLSHAYRTLVQDQCWGSMEGNYIDRLSLSSEDPIEQFNCPLVTGMADMRERIADLGHWCQIHTASGKFCRFQNEVAAQLQDECENVNTQGCCWNDDYVRKSIAQQPSALTFARTAQVCKLDEDIAAGVCEDIPIPPDVIPDAIDHRKNAETFGIWLGYGSVAFCAVALVVIAIVVGLRHFRPFNRDGDRSGIPGGMSKALNTPQKGSSLRRMPVPQNLSTTWPTRIAVGDTGGPSIEDMFNDRMSVWSNPAAQPHAPKKVMTDYVSNYGTTIKLDKRIEDGNASTAAMTPQGAPGMKATPTPGTAVHELWGNDLNPILALNQSASQAHNHGVGSQQVESNDAQEGGMSLAAAMVGGVSSVGANVLHAGANVGAVGMNAIGSMLPSELRNKVAMTTPFTGHGFDSSAGQHNEEDARGMGAENDESEYDDNDDDDDDLDNQGDARVSVALTGSAADLASMRSEAFGRPAVQLTSPWNDHDAEKRHIAIDSFGFGRPNTEAYLPSSLRSRVTLMPSPAHRQARSPQVSAQSSPFHRGTHAGSSNLRISPKIATGRGSPMAMDGMTRQDTKDWLSAPRADNDTGNGGILLERNVKRSWMSAPRAGPSGSDSDDDLY